jgi:hypothetical protein
LNYTLSLPLFFMSSMTFITMATASSTFTVSGPAQATQAEKRKAAASASLTRYLLFAPD